MSSTPTCNATPTWWCGQSQHRRRGDDCQQTIGYGADIPWTGCRTSGHLTRNPGLPRSHLRCPDERQPRCARDSRGVVLVPLTRVRSFAVSHGARGSPGRTDLHEPAIVGAVPVLGPATELSGATIVSGAAATATPAGSPLPGGSIPAVTMASPTARASVANANQPDSLLAMCVPLEQSRRSRRRPSAIWRHPGGREALPHRSADVFRGTDVRRAIRRTTYWPAGCATEVIGQASP